MIELLQTLKLMFDQVTKESYLEINDSEKINYPYLTYSLDIDNINRNTDGFYLDIDIFDENSSFINIFNLESLLRKNFDFNQKFTDGLFIRFYFQRSFSVKTQSDTLKRRNLQIYCKVDWRNK